MYFIKNNLRKRLLQAKKVIEYYNEKNSNGIYIDILAAFDLAEVEHLKQNKKHTAYTNEKRRTNKNFARPKKQDILDLEKALAEYSEILEQEQQ